jgi:hypothetical protein
MMNLEEIEQRTLKYLMEVSTPLVPVDTLLRFLQRHGEFPDLTEDEFVGFLRHHELFRVIDPLPLPNDPEAEKNMAEAGFRPRPRVVLCTRIPTAQDLKEGMLEELGKMLEALGAALDNALHNRDMKRARELRAIIGKAKTLAEKLETLG